MSHLMVKNNHTGIAFNVRIVRRGDRYGRNNCIEHCEEMPLVEFYDARFPHTPIGQFVSRYYLDTLLSVGGGLCLDGGIPDWRLTAANMREVQAWIRAGQMPRHCSRVAQHFIDLVRAHEAKKAQTQSIKS